MKSELTIEIETALRNWNPETLSGLLINEKRDSIRVSEVCVANSDTKDGIVDFVRAEEYKVEDGYIGLCWLGRKANATYCEKGLAPGTRRKSCEQYTCRFNNKKETYNYDHKLFTAIEIKITLADFKSSHGHNFIGNLNYYAIPKELYPQIINLIPEDIGLLIYANNQLFEKKQSKYNELTADEQLTLTWNVLKATRMDRNINYNKVTKSIFTRTKRKR